MAQSSYPSLTWLQGTEDGLAWLTNLPRLVRGCVEEWGLRLGEPFRDAHISMTTPAKLSDGTEVVLKVQFPHRESEHEAAALGRWNGEGAIRLLAHDAERHALLLERCIPGTPLSNLNQNAAMSVVARLLPRLWKSAGAPFRDLAREAAWWADDLLEKWMQAGMPFERTLLDAALDVLRTLPLSQGEQVLLHQDLHGENILRAEREPWLAIDPKPLTGEREFSVAPIVRSFESGHGRREVEYRLDLLTAELGLDRERARLWTLAQTIAWSFGSDYFKQHVETARWLLEMAT